MITISKKEKKSVIIWSFVFGFFIAQTFSFVLYLLLPSSLGLEKKHFLIIDLILIIVFSIIIKILIFFGIKFSSSIRINR